MKPLLTIKCACFFIVMLIFACEKNADQGPKTLTHVSTDTAFNVLRVCKMNPNQTVTFHAYQFSERMSSIQDLYLTEWYFRDSLGDDRYRLRLYTHLKPFNDSIQYETTNNRYNTYDDKVYIEWYKDSAFQKVDHYVSELPQTENFFNFNLDSTQSKTWSFRYLSKSNAPERYATILAQLKLIAQ